MENASKALLIAGAILLVIAIIAIGVGIVSKTRGAINGAENQIDTMKVQMHNSIFQKYEGREKDFYQVKDILSEVIAYNNTNTNPELNVMVKVGYYTNPENTEIEQHCERTAEKIYEGTCVYYRSKYSPKEAVRKHLTQGDAIDYLYDIYCEYNSSGIVSYIKLVRRYK